MSRLTLAVYGAAGCGGCDIALLELHEKLPAVLETVEFVFWPTIMDVKYSDLRGLEDAAIDVCLFNGAIRTEENAEIARLLRAKSRVMVAFGSCATTGGIPSLSNLFDVDDTLDRVFATESTDAPGETVPGRTAVSGNGHALELTPLTGAVLALSQVVEVDYFVPGCPPVQERVSDIADALASGDLPDPPAILGAGERSVCDECPLEKRGATVSAFRRPHEIVPDGTTCLLEQGLVCVGPATRSGCGAKCVTANMPCRGCYGSAGLGEDQGAAMISAIGSVVTCADEDVIRETVAGVVDPAGTFYRFGLATSTLGRARSGRTRTPGSGQEDAR